MFLAKKIIGLDILRFLMALIMVTYHVQPLLEKSFLNELNFNGFLATSTFFILSGFILTHVYYKKIQINTFSNTNFLIKRFSALYPIHIFTLLISILFFFILHFIMKKSFPIEVGIHVLPGLTSDQTFSINFKDILFYILETITLVHAWDYRFLFFNGASWSISTLLFFYLFFFILVKNIKDIKNLKKLLILFWCLSLLPIIYLTSLQNFSNEIVGFIHRNPLLRLPDFIFGILFYLICLRVNKYSKKIQFFSIIFSILGFLSAHYLVKNNPQNWFFLAHNGLFLFPEMGLIYAFLNINISNTKIKVLIEKLGKCSLTIYMLHLPLLAIYTTIYKLILASFNSKSLNELVLNAKNIEYINIPAFIVFMIILLAISYFLQEKVFTPIQIKLSNRLIIKKDLIHSKS